MTGAKNGAGQTLSGLLGAAFTHVASHATFAPIVGAYSALLGLFVPSGGGKWIIEAPYVMHAANALHYNLGWVVQIYNAAEALPNLINPFWMLPILGILGLKARDLIGFTVVQFAINLPLVLLLLVGASARTLPYHPPLRRPDRKAPAVACLTLDEIPAAGRERRPIAGRRGRDSGARHRAAPG